MECLQRKYNHAKRIISELKRHEQFLAVQLQERDNEYNSHLRLLRDRVVQLERELATTQKYAGIPVRLPYEDQLGGAAGSGHLSPPELLKQPPVSIIWFFLLLSCFPKSVSFIWKYPALAFFCLVSRSSPRT